MALDVSGSSSLFWKTKIDNTGLQTGAIQAKGILSTLSRQITGMDIFAGLGIGAALVFSKMAKQAYNFSKEFETSMKEVQTISKMVQGNFEGISQEIIDMSKTGPESALNLTKALYQIISAGIDGAEAMDILRQSMELAVGGVTNTFTAADALTSIINAYGEAAGNATNISDKLFTVVRLGKTNMEELGPEITTVTGLAAQAGLAFDDLMAIIAQGTRTLKTPEMMTGIRGMLNAIITPSEEAKKLISELGIEFDSTALKGKGFKTFLNDVMTATGGNIEQLSKLFPNIRALTGLLAVAGDQGKEFNKALIEVQNSTGATSEAFKIMVDTTQSQMAIMKNNIMAKLKPLGDSLLSTMNEIARSINIAMSGATDELSNLSRSYSELTDILKSKQNRIDDLIATVENLRGKTKLTKEETTQLHAAEKALAIYFPTLGKAAEGAGKSIDILSLAKEGTIDLSIRIMELDLAQAKIEMRRADLAKELYDRNEDAGNKEIKRINKQIKAEEDLAKWIVTGGEYELYEQEQLNDMIEINLRDNNEYLKLQKDLSIATEKRALEEDQLNQNQEKSYEIVDILNKSLEELRITREKPVVIPPTTGGGEPPKTITTPIAITDEEIKDIDAKLAYMANRYKLYLSDVTQFGEEYVEKHNAQLIIDGENYSQYLSNMLAKYKGNAGLTKIIIDDIYEYNKTIEEKKKKIEDELFGYITEAREKDLQAEKDTFDIIIKRYEEGSTEYLSAIEKHNKNIIEINDKYDKEIAEAALAIFKESLEKQTDELDNNYKLRLEIAKEGLGKETEANKEYFEFINIELKKITTKEEEVAKEKRELLDSYFESYQTTEEKIVSIHKKTAELLLLTDDKYEQDRLRSIEKQLIAEIEASEAIKEVNDKLAEYGENLNNKELEDKIATLEEMKLKYAEYADIVILLDEKIAESQAKIWENIRSEINDTVSALHNLADVVGNFDTELESMINDLANLVSGVGEIISGFAMGGIGGFAGIIGGIATVIGSIINLFVQHKTDVPELEEELKKITLELQAQQNILNQATGMAETAAIKERIALLREQIATYNDLIAAEEAAYGQFLWWTWDETDQAAIEGWLSSIESVNAEIYNLNQQYQQILTGTTAETIADAIADGFAQGLDSAQVFADTFNDMMKKAIVDAFKRTIITSYLESWYRFFAHLSEGGLTAEEINELAYGPHGYLRLLQRAETQWETIQDILGAAGIHLEDVIEGVTDVTDITGLTGAIAGITEDTAGLLAGQFMAIRINTVGILNNMESIIIINSQIADNTKYCRYLESIDKKLGELGSSSLRAIGGS